MIVVGCQGFKEECCSARLKHQWRIKRARGFSKMERERRGE
jgi:hypothetical protein